MVQALVADQSVINNLCQAILSAMGSRWAPDLPQHATELSRTNITGAPVGQSAEQSAVESVDQTGKVRAAKEASRSMLLSSMRIPKLNTLVQISPLLLTLVTCKIVSRLQATITTLRGCCPQLALGT